jgi:hypothetical protein
MKHAGGRPWRVSGVSYIMRSSVARAHWIALESENALPRSELQQLLTHSYGLVFTKLPKKPQLTLSVRKPSTRSSRNRRKSRSS